MNLLWIYVVEEATSALVNRLRSLHSSAMVAGYQTLIPLSR